MNGLLDDEHETLSERKDDVAVLVRDEPAAIRRDGVGDKRGVRRTRPAERQQLAVVLTGFSVLRQRKRPELFGNYCKL